MRELLQEFGSRFGWPWVPVRFCHEPPPGEPQEMRFCEAIRGAAVSPVVLTKASVTCAGALRSFGWDDGADSSLAEEVSREQSLPAATAKKMIGGIPRLDDGVIAVEVGTKETPDVLVSYAQPPTAMRIVRALERRSGKPLRPCLTSVLSVCGAVAVRSHLTGEVTVSFGCDTSRKSGSIGPDRMIIGVPWREVPGLLQR